MCRSPKLIAAYHVLLRLQKPRHPPYALILLIVLRSAASLQRSCAFYLFVFSYPNMSMNFCSRIKRLKDLKIERFPCGDPIFT